MSDDGFVEHRPRLFALAYRMLGSVAEAEDILQEAWLRYQQPAGAQPVRSVGAYLTTIVTRLCIDHLRSARVRREAYPGPWLPEPVLSEASGMDDGGADPEAAAVLADSLSLAFLVVLEELNPMERAAFLLHEVFGYPYERDLGDARAKRGRLPPDGQPIAPAGDAAPPPLRR
ncbi:MAG: sigma factor [Acidimicrobiales bacterium]